jgi:hypothetical protein
MRGLPFCSVFLQVREERNSPSIGDSGRRSVLLNRGFLPLADSEEIITSAWADGLRMAEKATSKIGGKQEKINKYEMTKERDIYLTKGDFTRANAGSWERPAAGNTQTKSIQF